jgi:multidrug efflux pump subunit AcrA (membrane-fusion protein)
MAKKGKIIAGSCVAVAAIVAGVYLFNGRANSNKVMVATETLQEMSLKNTVSLTGVVESETGRKVYSTLSYPVESVNVEVGDVVQEGDVLAKLKTSGLELDIAQQKAAVNASKNQSAHQIEVSRKAYENAKENYENNLNASAISAEQGVTQAENGVTQAKYGVDSARLQVENAEAAVRNARENYVLTRDQLDGAVDTAERALEDAEDALSQAQSAYNSAVANMDKQIADAKNKAEKDYQELYAQYGEAMAEWEHLEETYRIDIQVAKENLETANGELAEAKKELEENPDDSELKKKVEEKEQAVAGAKEEVEKAQYTHLTEKEKYQSIESALNQAKANIENSVANVTMAAQSGISSASGAVASAQGGVSAAEAQVDAARDARNGATLAQIEQGIDTARRGVESAEVQKDVAKAQKKAAEQAAEQAKQQQEAAKTSIEQQIDSLKDTLVGSQISAQSTQSQEIAIQKLQNTLDEATITAPVSGVVTAVYAKVGEPGNGLLFVVEDTESLKVKTKIKEYDIAHVQVGMPVIIKSDATGDREIPGVITEIAPAAIKTDSGSIQSASSNSAVEFEAEVQVNEKNSGLRIGMNTRMTVLLEEKENVFGVPYDSVVEKADGTEVLYAVQPKGTQGKDADTYVVQEVPVTTGLETDFYVEVSGTGITNGMSILSDPQSVTPGMEVTPDFVTAGSAEPVVGLSGNGAE